MGLPETTSCIQSGVKVATGENARWNDTLHLFHCLAMCFFCLLKHWMSLKTCIYIYRILRINEKSRKDKNTKKELWCWDQRGYYISPMSTSWLKFVSELLATSAKKNVFTHMIQHCHKTFNAILIRSSKNVTNTGTYNYIFSYEKGTMECSEDPQNLYRFNKQEARWCIEAKWHMINH